MKRFISAVAFASITILASASALSAEKSKTMGKGMDMGAETTTEQRQKMAAMHEHMAICLRSDKPMAECKKEMMKSCEDSMGKECPMMHGMKDHTMKHDGMKENDKSDN
jgi:hypothetical protein